MPTQHDPIQPWPNFERSAELYPLAPATARRARAGSRLAPRTGTTNGSDGEPVVAEHGFCTGCGRPLHPRGGSLRPRNAAAEDWPEGDGWVYVQDEEHARTWNRSLMCDPGGGWCTRVTLEMHAHFIAHFGPIPSQSLIEDELD